MLSTVPGILWVSWSKSPANMGMKGCYQVMEHKEAVGDSILPFLTMKKVVDFLIVCPRSVHPAVSPTALGELAVWLWVTPRWQGAQHPTCFPLCAACSPRAVRFFHLPLYVKFCFHLMFQVSWFKHQEAKASPPVPLALAVHFPPKRLQLPPSVSFQRYCVQTLVSVLPSCFPSFTKTVLCYWSFCFFHLTVSSRGHPRYNASSLKIITCKSSHLINICPFPLLLSFVISLSFLCLENVLNFPVVKFFFVGSGFGVVLERPLPLWDCTKLLPQMILVLLRCHFQSLNHWSIMIFLFCFKMCCKYPTWRFFSRWLSSCPCFAY